jgi:ABC-type cobalt transport system substrate-binding protein
MNDRVIYLLVIIGTTLLFVTMFVVLYSIGNYLGIDHEARYDCSIAEISPDFSPTMKAECRKKLKESVK